VTLGPREMAARKAVLGPITVRDERVIRWARIEDQWDLASHNLFVACRSTGRAFEKLTEALVRIKAEHPEDEL
jgi:hypothetical protein